MKINRILVLCVAMCMMLTSCALGLRNTADTGLAVTSDAPDENTAEATAEDTTVTESVPTEPEESTSVATEVTTEEVTEPVTESETTATPEPPAAPTGSYKPKAFMYHLIREDVYGPYDNLFVRPHEFETHLTVLDELGYEYLFAEEWRITEKPSVIITLDDGYDDNYTEMFPILKAHGAKATVFIVTDLIGTDGYMTKEQIREMSESGLVSFQCHTAHHRDLSYQSADSLHADFAESIEIIEGITGKPVTALAYPGGSFNNTVLSVVPDYFDFAYTTKSPTSYPDYTAHTVPRYYIARGFGRANILNIAKY